MPPYYGSIVEIQCITNTLSLLSILSQKKTLFSSFMLCLISQYQVRYAQDKKSKEHMISLSPLAFHENKMPNRYHNPKKNHLECFHSSYCTLLQNDVMTTKTTGFEWIYISFKNIYVHYKTTFARILRRLIQKQDSHALLSNLHAAQDALVL